MPRRKSRLHLATQILRDDADCRPTDLTFLTSYTTARWVHFQTAEDEPEFRVRNVTRFGRNRDQFRLLDIVLHHTIRLHFRACFQLLPREPFSSHRYFRTHPQFTTSKINH